MNPTVMRATRPDLVLVHAFPLNAAMWDEQITSLSDICSVHALNLPGFGSKPEFAGDALTMIHAAEYVMLEIAKRGIDRCVLGGLSMGGYTAFECLRLFGDRIEGLILADTKATPDPREARIGRRASAERVARGDVKGYIEDLLVTVLGRTTRETRPDVVERVRGLMRAAPSRSIIAALIGMAGRRDSSDLLSSITVPTALIYGNEDGITTVEEGRMMAAAIPDATMTIIEGAGHLANIDAPDAFNDAVRALLRRIA